MLPQTGGREGWGKDFAVVIKDLQIGRLSWIIQISPKCSHTYPYKRETEGVLTHRGEGDVKTKQRDLRMLTLRTGVRQPQAKECQSH